MLLDGELESTGFFHFPNEQFPGIISVKRGKPIEIKILTYEPIKWILEEIETQKIEIIHGTIRSEGVKITIYNSIIYQSHHNLGQLYEYTIKSNLMIYDQWEEPLKDLLIPQIHFCLPNLNRWIGNSILKISYDYNEKIGTYIVPFESIKEYGTRNDYKISLYSMNNDHKYSVRNRILIEQRNSIMIEYKKPFSIDDIYSLASKVKGFFTFIFQIKSEINEIIYFKTYKHNDKEIRLHQNIYYAINKPESDPLDDRKILLSWKEINEKLLILLTNWINLYEKVEYLKYYINLYFSTNFIDQKVIAKINLIESIHLYYYGPKQPDSEILDFKTRILSEIHNPDDKEKLLNIIENKTGYGLSKKIGDLSNKAKITNINKKLIREINAFRSCFAHGHSLSKFTSENLSEMDNFLSEIINKIIISYLLTD